MEIMRIEFEHIQRDKSTSFLTRTFTDKSFTCPYHIHDEYELVLIKEGRGRIVVGDYAGRFEPGELYLFGPNLPHTFFSDPAQEGEERLAHSHYIQFKKNCFGEHFFNLPEMKVTKKTLKNSVRGLRFSGFDSNAVLELFQQIELSDSIMRLAHFLQIQDFLIKCETSEKLATEQYLRADSHHESERLNRAIDFIHRKFTQQVTLDDVAAAAHLSPAAFSRFFHKYMDQRFIDYLIELRLSEACRLLLETDLPITEISIAVGFNNLSNFNRQFLKRKSISPRNFRKH